MSKNTPIDLGNIGDFQNNQVLDWTPISFSVEFIFRLRREKKHLQNIPSTRQAVAIPKLLTAMYYRKFSLIPDDFITAAVITTPIEDQEIARKIAFEMLFPNQPKPTSSAGGKKEAKTTSKSDDASIDDDDDDDEEGGDILEDLLTEVLGSELDLGSLDSDKEMEMALNELSKLMDFVDQMYDKAGNGEDPYKSLLDILDPRGGYRNILGQGLKTLESLQKAAQECIQRDVNTLSPQDIIAATQLQWGNDILSQTTSPWIKAATQFCMNHPDFQSTLNDIMNNEDVGTATRTAQYLKDVGMDPDLASKLGSQLVNKANDLMDILEISKVLGHVPNFNESKIFQNSLQRDLGTMFNASRLLDNFFNQDITKRFFDYFNQSKSDASLSELYQARCDHQPWRDSVNKCISSELKDMLSGNGQAASNMTKLATDLMQLSVESEFNSCSNTFKENAVKASMQSLEKANSSDQFEDLLRDQLTYQVPLNERDVVELGAKKGIPAEVILEIFGGNYDLLKIMIEKKIGNFIRYQAILNKLGGLSIDQMKELMQAALQSGNLRALGALGHKNMGMAFKAASEFGPKTEDSLAESLSAGSGENLLMQWFWHRNAIPNRIKDFVRKLVKDALITIALNMISSQRGSGEKGLVPTNKLRIYIDGDDMDLIDVDASIENIVMQGKSLDLIQTDDLLVMETEKGRVSICFLLDISGSMSGDKLAACAIAVMVLIGSLRAEEVAVCFFESNTHVVKEFGDNKDLDDLADELMDLHATGGTRVQKALEWGAKQLEQTSTELKICFLLTDCEFGEGEHQIKKDLESYLDQRVKFLLGVNTRSYSTRYAKWILETTKGEIVYILNILDIPKVLMEVLEKIG